MLNAALNKNCESFTLISTDKAVRPTNVMGATKRLAEMVCQLSAETNIGPTVISMVRFGNVLGSSGSVIPTFQQQIKRGGPVTPNPPGHYALFHDHTRGSAIGYPSCWHGGKRRPVSVDMGTPVKIIDLAERLIRLSGKSINETPTAKPLAKSR